MTEPTSSRPRAPRSSSTREPSHQTGTREEWLAARLELLKAEKALTRRSDELAQCGINHEVKVFMHAMLPYEFDHVERYYKFMELKSKEFLNGPYPNKWVNVISP